METLIICLEVFFARMIEISIGSVRTIFLVKGKNALCCLLAFIEILIWFYVARETLTANDPNIAIVLSYAGGYAIGTYVGWLINKYLVNSPLTAFVVTTDETMNEKLKKEKFGVSTISREDGKIILLIEFKKRNLKNIKKLISKIDKKAFIIVNESLNTENGYIN